MTVTEPTFRDVFAGAIARRQVSLAWLSQKLAESGRPVSVTALSYWRSGRSQPERATSLEALDEIEGLLDLPAGRLGSLIGPSRRPGPRPAERTTAQMFADRPGILPALQALGFGGYDDLAEDLRQITVDVDATGCVTGVQVRALARARRDGARRSPVIVTVDDPGHVPTFVAVAGCSFGRSRMDPASGVFATELILDRELALGAAHLFELQVLFSAPSPRHLVRPLRGSPDGRTADLGQVRPGPAPGARGAVHPDRPRLRGPAAGSGMRHERACPGPGLRPRDHGDPLDLVTPLRASGPGIH